MPITSIHEEVALNISNKYKELDTKNFYLGNYAPDSVNQHGLAEKTLRWTAHQRKENRNEWRKSLREFYKKEKNNYPKDFILGYITHILTDIIYDDLFYDEVVKKIKSDNPTIKDAHSIMGEDMYKYAYNSKYRDKVKLILENQDKFYNILNVSENMMELFKIKTLREIVPKEKSIYINEILIDNLSTQVVKELQEYLED